jgi:predicted acyltransferase (DUF342 family)
MARSKGTFNFSANLEPVLKAPLDAKMLVQNISDLTNSSNWITNGSNLLYDGAIVAVANDGVYQLVSSSLYTSLSSWRKLSYNDEFLALSESFSDGTASFLDGNGGDSIFYSLQSLGTLDVGSDTTIGGNLVVDGTITAQAFETEIINSTVLYDSGSTKFGDSFDDTHEFTGSVEVTNSLSINGNLYLNNEEIVLAEMVGGTRQDTGSFALRARFYPSAGATARGTGSVDLQSYRSSTTQAAYGIKSVISGGENNTIYSGSYYSVIAGGRLNTIHTNGNYNYIVGNNGTIHSNNDFSTILNGSGNVIQSRGIRCTIIGGLSNQIYQDGTQNTILGGSSNVIREGTDWSTIVNGDNATIAETSSRVFIGIGDNTTVSKSDASFIGVGPGSYIINSYGSGMVASDISNIYYSQRSFIGSGYSHYISASINSSIVAGNNNGIGKSANSLIGAGTNNTIYTSADSAIGGGDTNLIWVSNFSFIGAGYQNKVSGSHRSAIIGGIQNSTENYDDVFILGSGVKAHQSHTTYVDNLYVSRSFELGQDLYVSGNLDVDGNARILGWMYPNQYGINQSSHHNFVGTLDLSGSLEVSNDISVGGNVGISGSLVVDGPTTINGPTTFYSPIQVVITGSNGEQVTGSMSRMISQVPTGSYDSELGQHQDLAMDDAFLYVKSGSIWRRTPLSMF